MNDLSAGDAGVIPVPVFRIPAANVNLAWLTLALTLVGLMRRCQEATASLTTLNDKAGTIEHFGEDPWRGGHRPSLRQAAAIAIHAGVSQRSNQRYTPLNVPPHHGSRLSP